MVLESDLDSNLGYRLLRVQLNSVELKRSVKKSFELWLIVSDGPKKDRLLVVWGLNLIKIISRLG
jgi:hypothetical protein